MPLLRRLVYQRNTTVVDVIINEADSVRVKKVLLAELFDGDDALKEFRRLSGVPVQFLIAG